MARAATLPVQAVITGATLTSCQPVASLPSRCIAVQAVGAMVLWGSASSRSVIVAGSRSRRVFRHPSPRPPPHRSQALPSCLPAGAGHKCCAHMARALEREDEPAMAAQSGLVLPHGGLSPTHILTLPMPCSCRTPQDRVAVATGRAVVTASRLQAQAAWHTGWPGRLRIKAAPLRAARAFQCTRQSPGGSCLQKGRPRWHRPSPCRSTPRFPANGAEESQRGGAREAGECDRFGQRRSAISTAAWWAGSWRS